MSVLIESPEWQALKDHYQEIHSRHLRDLFREDEGRAAALSVEDCGLLVDYSKNRVTRRTMDLLLALAGSDQIGLKQAIEAMRPIQMTMMRHWSISGTYRVSSLVIRPVRPPPGCSRSA